MLTRKFWVSALPAFTAFAVLLLSACGPAATQAPAATNAPADPPSKSK